MSVQGCKDKYRDFQRTGRVRYRSFSREASPGRGRYRSRSPDDRGRGGRSSRRSRSRSRGRGRGGRDEVNFPIYQSTKARNNIRTGDK